MKSNSRAFLMATTAALLLGAASVARAEDAVDHSKMDHSGHGAAAPTQWADPGKAKPDGAESNNEDHSAMKHGGKGGMMGGMGGMMGGGMGGMKHDADGGMNMGGMMKKMTCGFADHVDGRIAYAKAELKITDQQNAAWNSFADAWRAAAQKAMQKCESLDKQMDMSKGMDHSKPMALHKLEMMETHMVDHLEVVRAQKSALAPLYAALTDEQKKAANDVFAQLTKNGMGQGGGMGGMKHGGGGGGMDHGGMQH